jgi:hypothetical protein
VGLANHQQRGRRPEPARPLRWRDCCPHPVGSR